MLMYQGESVGRQDRTVPPNNEDQLNSSLVSDIVPIRITRLRGDGETINRHDKGSTLLPLANDGKREKGRTRTIL